MIKARDSLIYFFIKYGGNQDKVTEAINRHEKLTAKEVTRVLEGVDTSRYVTMFDDDYPSDLKVSDRPPLVFKRMSEETRERVVSLLKKELAEAKLNRENFEERDLLLELIAIVKNHL